MDRFSYDGSEPKVVATCAECSGDIRVGDAVTRYDNGNVTHDDCADNYLRSFIATWGVIDANGNVE